MYKRVNKRHFSEELKLTDSEIQAAHEEEEARLAAKELEGGSDEESINSNTSSEDEEGEDEDEEAVDGEAGVLKGHTGSKARADSAVWPPVCLASL